MIIFISLQRIASCTNQIFRTKWQRNTQDSIQWCFLPYYSLFRWNSCWFIIYTIFAAHALTLTRFSSRSINTHICYFLPPLIFLSHKSLLFMLVIQAKYELNSMEINKVCFWTKTKVVIILRHYNIQCLKKSFKQFFMNCTTVFSLFK